MPMCIAASDATDRDRFVVKAIQDFDNQKTSDRKAFVFCKDKEVWTWGRLTSEVNRLARGLIGLGIQQGDRVAFHMANLPELVVGYLACLQAGAIAAPLNILMRQDEKGNLWFVSRKKYLIIRGGSNISPVEVEEVLTSHPEIQDAAVIGVPDPELGERVTSFIQPVALDSQSSTLKDIRRHLAERLADYKIP